jgi:hypothetical protein
LNPYPSRIASLHEWLRVRYGQTDRQATEVLLAALLPPTPSTPRPPWFIIETDYPNRDTNDAWFSFGAIARVRCLSVARINRTHTREALLEEWIAERATGVPGLFVDAEWRRLHDNGQVASHKLLTESYMTLMAMCVRLRVDHPRTGRALRGATECANDARELQRLTRCVIDKTDRESHPRPRPPAGLLYWCELLQRVAPLQTDWESLTGAVAGVAYGIADLYNDGREPDWRAAERVMRDTIPWTTRALLAQTNQTAKDGIKAWRLLESSGVNNRERVYKELRRLREAGVVWSTTKARTAPRDHYQHHPWRYRMAVGASGQSDFATLLDRDKRILV